MRRLMYRSVCFLGEQEPAADQPQHPRRRGPAAMVELTGSLPRISACWGGPCLGQKVGHKTFMLRPQLLQKCLTGRSLILGRSASALRAKGRKHSLIVHMRGGTCRTGDGRSSERSLISSIVKDQLSLPPPDAKPEFHSVRACVMKIDPDQLPFFYNADAATGKKVHSAVNLLSTCYRPSLLYLLLHHPESQFISLFMIWAHTLSYLAFL